MNIYTQKSIIEQRGAVPFPEFTGERVYMREFFKDGGLPADLRRWQPTVDSMLDGVDTDGPIYIMIDQGSVSAGKAHRRAGLHIDGYWIPDIAAHGGGGRHSANSAWKTGPLWSTSAQGGDWPDEALILASDVTACRGYTGEWEGLPGDGGECSHIDVSKMQEVFMLPGVAYAGNVTALHESVRLATSCKRTLVRLNVPGWSPNEV